MMKKEILALSSIAMMTLMIILPAVSAITITPEYTTNWSGYVATAPTPFTSVSASWTVPTVTAASTPAFSAIWTGIGGWYRNSNKLIQAGTEQDVTSGGTSYFAWYEVYPKAPVNLATVNAGDSVTVSIYENKGNPATWHITITVNSIKLLDTDVRAKTNFASEASAEFIVERPLLVLGHQLASLADFTDITFSNCNAGSTGLGSVNSALAVTMTRSGTSSGTTLASPTTLSGNGFTVTWSAAS